MWPELWVSDWLNTRDTLHRSPPVGPAGARFDEVLGEYTLAYTAVRIASDPDAVLLEFLHSTNEAAPRCADWDRQNLERSS